MQKFWLYPVLVCCIVAAPSFAEPNPHEPGGSPKREIVSSQEIFAIKPPVSFEERQKEFFNNVRDQNVRLEELVQDFKKKYSKTFSSSESLRKHLKDLKEAMKSPQGISSKDFKLMQDQTAALKLMEEYDSLIKFLSTYEDGLGKIAVGKEWCHKIRREPVFESNYPGVGKIPRYTNLESPAAASYTIPAHDGSYYTVCTFPKIQGEKNDRKCPQIILHFNKDYKLIEAFITEQQSSTSMDKERSEVYVMQQWEPLNFSKENRNSVEHLVYSIDPSKKKVFNQYEIYADSLDNIHSSKIRDGYVTRNGQGERFIFDGTARFGISVSEEAQEKHEFRIACEEAQKLRRAGLKKVSEIAAVGNPRFEYFQKKSRLLNAILKMPDINWYESTCDEIKIVQGNAILASSAGRIDIGVDTPIAEVERFFRNPPRRIEPKKQTEATSLRKFITGKLASNGSISDEGVDSKEATRIYEIIHELLKKDLVLDPDMRNIRINGDIEDGRVFLAELPEDCRSTLMIPKGATAEQIKAFFVAKEKKQ